MNKRKYAAVAKKRTKRASRRKTIKAKNVRCHKNMYACWLLKKFGLHPVYKAGKPGKPGSRQAVKSKQVLKHNG